MCHQLNDKLRVIMKAQGSLKSLWRWFVLSGLLLGFLSFFYFRLYQYMSLSSLKQYRDVLLQWTGIHYCLTVMIFISLYLLAVTFSIPGIGSLTLLGGYLFGLAGTFYSYFSALIGSSLLFFAIRSTLGDWIAAHARGWVKKMEKGFQENAFNYVLSLRLIPAFPFWVVNIVSALLDVSFKAFISATAIGIVPGVIVYTMVGNSLHTVFQENHTADISMMLKPAVLLPMIGLSLLALLPVIYHARQKARRKKRTT